MNKNLVTIVGFILVGIIAYQAYLLGKKEALCETKIEKITQEPKVTVTIEEEPKAKKESRMQSATPHTKAMPNSTNEPLIDEHKIKEDLNKLFNDIFGSPKVKAELQKSLQEFQSQLKEGLSQFQKEMVMMSSELEKVAGQDELLKNLLQTFKLPKAAQFTDKQDHYEMQLNITEDNRNSVDIRVKGEFLIILINQIVTQEHNESGNIIKQEIMRKKQVVALIPEDADAKKLHTAYQNNHLIITMPKKESKK